MVRLSKKKRDAKNLKTAVKECSNCGKEKKLECFRRRHEGFGGNIVESCLTCEFPFCASCNRRLTEREGPLSKREMRKEIWPLLCTDSHTLHLEAPFNTD